MSPYQAGRLEKEFQSTKEGVVCGGGFLVRSRLGLGHRRLGAFACTGFWAQAPFIRLRFSIHSRLDLGIGRGRKRKIKRKEIETIEMITGEV